MSQKLAHLDLSLATFLVLLVFVLTGCQAPPTHPQPGLRDPALPYSKVMINDDRLADSLRFDEPIVKRDEAGFIRSVEITVRAAAHAPLRVDYRPIFLDSAGAVLQPESSWHTKMLEMRVPERINMLPTGLNAADFEIQFRWAR